MSRLDCAPKGKGQLGSDRVQNPHDAAATYRFALSPHGHECPRRDRGLGQDQPHHTVVVGELRTELQLNELGAQEAITITIHAGCSGVEGARISAALA
jgi:hypothetical protein